MRNISNKSQKRSRQHYLIPIGSVFVFLLSLLPYTRAAAQDHLAYRLSLEVHQETLGSVLEKIGTAGGFYFSYSSDALPKDSLVSLSASHESVESILNKLLKGNYEYKEAPNYIILRLAPNRLQLLAEDSPDQGEIHSITGYVIDDQTGEKIAHASVYEKRLLLSTLTDEQGYFKLKVKYPVSSLSLTISKAYYRDTTVVFLAPVPIHSDKGKNGRRPYGYRPGEEGSDVERTAFGRFFVSSKQKFQSLNLGGFFANAPVQTSLTPGLSTHGSLSSQVINKFSLNILGGYTFGVRGLEIAGIFNINKREMDAMQVAGIFNLVGGHVRGLQIGGVANSVLDSVKGMQVGGIYNDDKKTFQGMQIAGILNNVKGDVNGVQIAGIGNRSLSTVDGVQIAGIFNKARHLKGVQIGFINIADTTSGLSIGLLNFVGNGYKQLSISNNELTHFNLEYKSGNAKLYTILKAGMRIIPDDKAFVFGAGFGHDFIYNPRTSLSTELLSQNVYLGDWAQLSNLYQVKTRINYRFSKRFGIFAGPTFNLFVNDQTTPVKGYKNTFPFAGHSGWRFSPKTNGWIGWDIGITLF